MFYAKNTRGLGTTQISVNTRINLIDKRRRKMAT